MPLGDSPLESKIIQLLQSCIRDGDQITNATTLVGTSTTPDDYASSQEVADIRRAAWLKRFDELMDAHFGPNWDAP